MKPKRKRTLAPSKRRPVASVRKAALSELEAFYSMRLHHYVAEFEGEAIAMGTLSRSNGALWGWFDCKEGLTGRQSAAVVWAIIRGLRAIREPVYVTSNEGVHPTALRLLKAVGFRATNEFVQGKQIWVRAVYDDSEPLKLGEAA